MLTANDLWIEARTVLVREGVPYLRLETIELDDGAIVVRTRGARQLLRVEDAFVMVTREMLRYAGDDPRYQAALRRAVGKRWRRHAATFLLGQQMIEMERAAFRAAERWRFKVKNGLDVSTALKLPGSA